ncbi:patatin-like protein 6 [Cynara cardunculus var. scolymus]|uniref:Patatin n=1 Tax=Cynara cardunculus var. scolymus TaxID=59895 RepID=A0A118K434_CYNCS|nr:patatin-like protein 6 [Cynara cardunculus var. scolymus]KVI06883.1 Acyl transferase/acyl hydrolase/lysophospholipase [Cynara cardunculus var. scolymus]
MASNHPSLEMLQEPSIDTDKLSYEIFSILESKFLFGYDDPKLWKPKQVSPQVSVTPTPVAVGDDNGVQAIKNQRGKICVLSIDGGGMRSILAGKALAYLENALKVKSGNQNARIADYFDVAAGTGVGGVFTAMLFGSRNNSSPIFKAEDTWKFLAEQGKRLYQPKSSSGSGRGEGFLKRILRGGNSSGGVTHATAGFENAMKEAFTVNGQSLTLKNTLKPVLIPCYDLSSSAPFLFSRADALETDSFDFRLWEVCRATTALPGLFEPVSMKSVDGKTRCVAVDGGLAMSNPTAAAITHVLHNKQEFPFVRGVEDLLVLSFGTGQLLEGNYDYNQVKGWKAKDWARPMARISGDTSADMVDHAISMAFGQSRSSNYVRIQANGSDMGRCGVNVDSDCSPSNVKLLTGIADEMLKQKNVESVLFGGKRIGEQSNFEKLDWFAGELVLEHQRRSCRIAPTVAFKQATPKPI